MELFEGGTKMATQSKCREAIFPSIGLVFFFIIANLAFAETKVFLEEYTYQAGEADSRLSSRVIALEQIKRLLLEKLGTYLESATEVKNLQLTKDQIAILTAGIVSAEIIDERWDGKTYYLKAKITADPQDVIKSIGVLRHDRQKTKELEETRKKADEALREVERLKKELNIAKAGKIEQERYNKAVNQLSAEDWIRKGLALTIVHKYREAVEAYTKAIELVPTFADAYLARGTSYFAIEVDRMAIKDFDSAIKLNTKYAIAYGLRGRAYNRLGDYRQAISDCTKEIELDPNALSYDCRANAYGKLGNFRQAIGDYDIAIQLAPDPKAAASYYMLRAGPYFKLGDYRQAISDTEQAMQLDPKNTADPDVNGFLKNCYVLSGAGLETLGDYRQAIKAFDRYIEMDPKDAVAYCARANDYGNLGDYRQAIRDCDESIALNPKYGKAYYTRALSYENLGDYRQAIRDYDKAIELNPNMADAYRQRGVCYGKLGENQHALKDWTTAARLGDKQTQDVLRSKGISW